MNRPSQDWSVRGLAARHAAAAWLDWYDQAGVNSCIDVPASAYRETGPTPQRGDAPPVTTRAPRTVAPAPGAAIPAKEAAQDPVGRRVASARALAAQCASLSELERFLRSYEGCPLTATATQLCFADGAAEAPVMLIGEAPGAEEDRQGKPFVGQSGQLLDRMLAAIGLDRTSVWITNIVFWRPPGNRPPTTAELAICQPFLERQIELLAPRCLVLLGGAAARAVLGMADSVGSLRGRRLAYEPGDGRTPIPAIVTYHPANLLRNPLNKRFVWRDFLRLRAQIETP